MTTHVPVSRQDLLVPTIAQWIARLDGDLGIMCGYQLGLSDRDGQPTGTVSGKLIRPAFALACGQAAGGDLTDAIPAAIAIELLHNASLIHDDIMDRDLLRRHKPTVWAEFGESAAILAGDALIALGFEVLAGHSHPRTAEAMADLAMTLRLLAHGQQDDLRFEDEQAVTVSECIAMLLNKTGTLLGCACRLGAMYAGAPADWVDRFGLFGSHLGVAFQLIDDQLGIWGDPGTTGKPAGSDLRARKKSAPVAAALASESPAGRELAVLYNQEQPLTDDDVTSLTELVEQAGGLEWTRAETRRCLSAAWDQIDCLDLDPGGRAELAGLTAAVADRVS
jgi:geranylgeranyl diphosphate synthase, type I